MWLLGDAAEGYQVPFLEPRNSGNLYSNVYLNNDFINLNKFLYIGITS